MIIHPETSTHISAVRDLNIAVFPTEAEANLVDALRANGDAEISLVALENEAVLGFIMLSRVEAPFRALALAPVAVREDQREQGLAAALITESLIRANAAGWEGIFILGDPEYYQRFGFSQKMAKGFDCTYAGPNFMAMSLLEEGLPCSIGQVIYAPAFKDLA